MAQKAPKGLEEPRFLGPAPAPVNPFGGLKYSAGSPSRSEWDKPGNDVCSPHLRRNHLFFQRLIERKRAALRWLFFGMAHGKARPGGTLSGQGQAGRRAG